MFTLNCKGKLLEIREPVVMGVINVTPDSFYEGSRFIQTTIAGAEKAGIDAIVRKAGQMIGDGAGIIDIGAQSSRPGAQLLSADEELFRLKGVFEALTRHFPDTPFSIDSFYSRVASEAAAAGASIINDISGGSMDNQMLATAGKSGLPYICMHMRGTPQTMQQLTGYENVTLEVLDYFIAKTEACRLAGIKDIIIDPGFGFSKNNEQNFELLKNMPALQVLDKPILAGLSRKSMVYKTLGVSPEWALNGTTAVNMLALMHGANILRAHDVREARECIALYREWRDAGICRKDSPGK